MKSSNPVANDLPSDSEIERAAVEVLRARMPARQDPIRVTVENGQVSLEGFVLWHHQNRVTAGVTQVTSALIVERATTH